MAIAFIKNNFLLILIVLLAVFLRFFLLDKIPSAIGGDELVYIITAKSLFLTGSDLSGTWKAFSIFFFNYPPGEIQAELPYFLFAPVVGFFNFSLFAARFTNALLSVFVVFVVYLITKKFFNKNTAIIAGFIAAINPWFIYDGRTSYDMTSAVLFYLLSFYFLTSKKGKHILLAIPFLLLSFYAYIATKVFFLPFVFAVVFYSYFVLNKRKFKKEYLAVVIFSLALVLFFITMLKVNPSSSRLGVILTPNNPQIAKEVDSIRRSSIQNPLLTVFENKYTVFLRIAETKLFNSFSVNYLFVTGDEFFSVWRHGLFYYLDSLFLILGGIFIFAKDKKLFFFFSILTLFASFPQIIHKVTTSNFTPHLALIFPFMIIFIANGISKTLALFKKGKYYFAVLTVILLLYIFSLLNFLNIYFFQHPLRGYFDFPIRVLSKYASLSKDKGQQVLVYSPSSPDIFKKYIFYTNSLRKDTIFKVRENVNKKEYRFNNVKFLSCDNTIDPLKMEEVIIYDKGCAPIEKDYKKIIIPRLDDGGETYRIYNDQICSKFYLKRYPSNLSISDFSLEKLDIKRFCQTFITSF
ncbi:MAG: glycosyltransferase family 39 protein [Candidatus Levyibacteriota bacterium]